MSIQLHKDKGVNCKMSICPRCGDTGDELLLMGAADTKCTCDSCGVVHYGFKARSKELRNGCKSCGAHSFTEAEIGEYEKIPASDICTKCKEELKKLEEMVSKGGVYFRCKECGREGVIQACEYTQAFREAAFKDGMIADITAPMGVEMSKCEEHTVTSEEDEKDKKD